MLLAGGYKIPENSANAVALGAANVAHNHNSADAAFYNPAKMVFMSDENHIDANLMYIGLSKVDYKGDVTGAPAQDISSESEDFIVPSFHYVSPKLGKSNARVGLSIVSPGGLSKRWENSIASYSAEEFTLQTVEINPTAAFEINKEWGVAVGFRMVHSVGIAKAQGKHPSLGNYSQDLEGDGFDVGYNFALAYQPTKNLEFGFTYRSKINLALDGDADLISTTAPTLNGNYDVSVDIPLPAAINLAMAYTLPSQTTLEFVYERTYWSAYQALDFEYANPVAEAKFGTTHPKKWKDANTYRFGVTQELETLTLMGGVVVDESPVPESTLKFELPDTDTLAFSLGARYTIDKNIDIALSGLYSLYDERKVSNSSLNGEFSGGDVLIISAGVGYRF